MILNVYMCKQFHYEITQLYSKVRMRDIYFKCVYVFCNNKLYHQVQLWLNGKTFGCD
jgi:hypothetical protein